MDASGLRYGASDCFHRSQSYKTLMDRKKLTEEEIQMIFNKTRGHCIWCDRELIFPGVATGIKDTKAVGI